MHWNGGIVYHKNCTFLKNESNSIAFIAYIAWFVDQIGGQKFLSARLN
jgi:hypothetical protein